jgi:rhodanese-related sulfurtransferase
MPWNLSRKPYRTVSPEQVATLADSGAILLDVRGPREWQAGHAPRARHIGSRGLPIYTPWGIYRASALY